MKNILIISQYAQEPPFNTMLRYHNFGKNLVKRGYNVSIVASSRVHNTNIDMIDYHKSDRSVVDGVNYLYVRTNAYNNNGIKRILNMVSFCNGIKKFRKENPDIVINCGAYSYNYTKRSFRKKPIITDITDLWPLSIVEYANVSPKHPLIRYLYHLEKKCYLKSDALIFSMEGGADYIKEQKYANKVNMDKVFHINMGIDLTKNDENIKKNVIDLAWDTNKFNVGYCGSIRQANNVKQICDAALELQKEGFKDVEFQIYGNGDELESLKEYCKSNSIKNIHFYGRIEKEKIPFILSNMKANILTYKQVGLMKYGGSQSKLFDYLAVGRPIICNAKFGYNLITRYNCGLVTDKQDSASFAKCIKELYSMSKDDLLKMGANSRKAAEDYDAPILATSLEGVFKYLEEKRGKTND